MEGVFYMPLIALIAFIFLAIGPVAFGALLDLISSLVPAFVVGGIVSFIVYCAIKSFDR